MPNRPATSPQKKKTTNFFPTSFFSACNFSSLVVLLVLFGLLCLGRFHIIKTIQFNYNLLAQTHNTHTHTDYVIQWFRARVGKSLVGRIVVCCYYFVAARLLHNISPAYSSTSFYDCESGVYIAAATAFCLLIFVVSYICAFYKIF